MSAQPTLWEWIPPAASDDLFKQLVAIADKLSREKGLYGVTVGEVVEAAESEGIKVGGLPMENKALEQRQTSWLPRVMRSAGLTTTMQVRRSPVPRHHGHRHTVWIRREVTA